MLTEDFREFVALLNANEVEYMVVGGYAVGLTREDFLEENNIIQLGYPPFRIDILTAIDGVTFAESYTQRSMVDVDGMAVSIIGREALLRNKKASGRLRDRDDLENLE